MMCGQIKDDDEDPEKKAKDDTLELLHMVDRDSIDRASF